MVENDVKDLMERSVINWWPDNGHLRSKVSSRQVPNSVLATTTTTFGTDTMHWVVREVNMLLQKVGFYSGNPRDLFKYERCLLEEIQRASAASRCICLRRLQEFAVGGYSEPHKA